VAHYQAARTPVIVTGITNDRLADGKIVEYWAEANTVRMLVQRGVRFVPDDKAS
jgi:hypothetical protein